MPAAAKQRKTRVTWTQREETLLAVEIHRMRNGEVDRRWPTGHEAVSLASQINLAQTRVLEEARRKSNSAVYTTASYDETWYQSALARRSLYEQTKPAEAAAPAAAASTPPANDADPAKERVVEVPEEPSDPETEHLLMLGNVVDAFARYIGMSIKRGVKEALVELRAEEEAKLRTEGNFTDTPDVPFSAREIVKRKIDVIGLMSIQRAVVTKSPVAKNWDIRFLQSGKEHGRAELRKEVIICSKFVSHSQQNRYRQMGAGMHWANGGAASVVRVLEELSRQTANGQNPMH